MPLDEYVKSEKEAENVSNVRKSYIHKYHKLIIESCKIDHDSTVVDIPCGTGDMSKKINEVADPSKLILIDINPNMIKKAKSKLPKNYEFLVGKAGNIANLVKDKVNSIFCLNGFHQYIDNKEEFLRGCYNILNNGGRLVFDISTRGLTDNYTRNFFNLEQKYLKEFAKDYNVTPTLPSWLDKSLLEDYKRLIDEIGFSLVDKKQFQDWSTTEDVYTSATKIPGRSRPWLKGMEYKKRREAFHFAINKTIEKIGKNKIESNRMFFILEKI